MPWAERRRNIETTNGLTILTACRSGAIVMPAFILIGKAGIVKFIGNQCPLHHGAEFASYRLA